MDIIVVATICCLLIGIWILIKKKDHPKQVKTLQLDVDSDVIQKAIRVREQTMEAMKKKKERNQSNPNQDPDLPPGQRWTKKWPVLDLGADIDLNLNDWNLDIEGLGEDGRGEQSLSLKDLVEICGSEQYQVPVHCVTSWSALDLKLGGIPFMKLIEHIKPRSDWKWLMQFGLDGYTVNVKREDVEREGVFIAFQHDGEPLSKEHGYIRLIIPHLYGWKGCKFLAGLQFLVDEEKGFWEQRGAHQRGRVIEEERWAEDEATKSTSVNEVLERCMTTNAKSLDLSNMNLTEIPQEVFQMTRLEELRLENNQIRELPSDIRKLQRLNRLVLSQNQISSIPKEIGELHNLSELYLINNQITHIPDELSQCENMVSLWFDNNRIEEIPASIGNLTEIGALSLDNNRISHLPLELSKLTQIRSLSFRKNPITKIPPEFHLLARLEQGWLGFDDGLIENISPSIAQEGSAEVIKELKRQYDASLQ
eukprot:TRINITY_DN9925_c0_g1_i1.p1 TRINITY_DN9925_c0_g1~~TRINITY_DN9925_c0_g1_i1.p1  ORF type:complete len:479 (-),score=119.57 TRINITY_DN9925_c0_g1_i1:1239-2675(-)